MKKFISLAVLVFCIFAYSYGQQNVRGGDFEHWRFVSAYNYYEPDSSIFSSLDTLNYAPTPPNGNSSYRCDTSHSGNYSARVVTRKIEILHVIIPGVVGTLKTNWTTEKAILGIPYPYGTGLPLRFSGYYQSYPVLDDTTAIVILLSKWNHATLKRDTLAYNRLVFHGTVSTWTKFDTAVTYRDHSKTPDTLTILLLSCAGFNASNMFGSVGQLGSMAMFDDVNLTGVSGFPLLLMPSVSVKLSPNPASQNMKMQFGTNVVNGYFEVYDAQAKLINQIPVNGVTGEINVSNLSAGQYYYKLTSNSKLLNSGAFMVKK